MISHYWFISGSLNLTSVVYDVFYTIIPNYLILIGYGMLIPYVVIVNGPGEIPFILIRIITVTAVLLIVYYVGGIMAGDVKLLGLISGYLCGTDVIKYIILVFYLQHSPYCQSSDELNH